jgi:hypothetical protein
MEPGLELFLFQETRPEKARDELDREFQNRRLRLCDGSYVGMVYHGGSQPVLFRWYGVAPEGWEGLARWHSETARLFEQVLQQALS